MSEMGHVMPAKKPSSSSSSSWSPAGLPPVPVLLLALAAAWAGPRLLHDLVDVINWYSGGILRGLDALWGLLSPWGLLGILPVVIVAVLGGLDGRTGTGLRVAAAAGLGVALGWSWLVRMLPSNWRPDSEVGAFFFYSVIHVVAGLVFAHWLAKAVASTKKQSFIAVVAWWGALCQMMLSFMNFAPPPAHDLVSIVVAAAWVVEILRLRAALPEG